MQSHPVPVALWLLATFVVDAVLALPPRDEPRGLVLLGLAVGQTVVAASWLFSRRYPLWVKITAALGVPMVTAALLAEATLPRFSDWFGVLLLVLSSSLLILGGWRWSTTDRLDAEASRYQFSVRACLGWMTSVGVLLASLRFASFPWPHLAVVLLYVAAFTAVGVLGFLSAGLFQSRRVPGGSLGGRLGRGILCWSLAAVCGLFAGQIEGVAPRWFLVGMVTAVTYVHLSVKLGVTSRPATAGQPDPRNATTSPWGILISPHRDEENEAVARG